MDDSDVDGDVGTVLNAESDVWAVVLTRGVVVESRFDVSSNAVAVCHVTKCVFDEVVALDVVNAVKGRAFDDVRENRCDNIAGFFHISFLLRSVISEGDQLVAATADCCVEIVFEEFGDEFAANCESNFVVRDTKLLNSCCSGVLTPEAIVRTFG